MTNATNQNLTVASHKMRSSRLVFKVLRTMYSKKNSVCRKDFFIHKGSKVFSFSIFMSFN